MILETKRLILRNWLESDLDYYATLSTDVGYNCFSPPGHFLVHSAEGASQKILNRITLFNERGLGKLPIFLKETGEFIGTCGMELFDAVGPGEVELGYRLCLKYWGKGYATEAAGAALRYGFNDLKLAKIMAIALPQNRASVRVLDKLGALYLRDSVHFGLLHRLYEIGRERFLNTVGQLG